MNDYNLRPFPYTGTDSKRSWRAHKQAIFDLAQSTYSPYNDQWNLLGEVMELAPYQALTGAVYVPTPAFVAQPAAAAAFPAWKHFDDQRSRNLVSISNLRQQVLKSLDEPSMALINVPNMGNRFRTMQQIMGILDGAYAGVSMNDIRENRAKMATPFVPGDPMRIWIQRQRECHSFAAQIAQAYPESEKVTAAVDALAVCGLYAPAIQRFLQVNPNPLLQTFDLLAVEVINHDDNLPQLATSATEGYGAAVRAEITPEQMEALATAVMSSMRMESTSEESLPTMIASAVRAEMKKVWFHGNRTSIHIPRIQEHQQSTAGGSEGTV
jgi:hypothetical protein